MAKGQKGKTPLLAKLNNGFKPKKGSYQADALKLMPKCAKCGKMCLGNDCKAGH